MSNFLSSDVILDHVNLTRRPHNILVSGKLVYVEVFPRCICARPHSPPEFPQSFLFLDKLIDNQNIGKMRDVWDKS